MATVLVGSQATGSAELRLSGSAALIATTVILGNRRHGMTSTVNLDGQTLQVNVIASGSGSGPRDVQFQRRHPQGEWRQWRIHERVDHRQRAQRRGDN